MFSAAMSRDPDDPSNNVPFSYRWACTASDGQVWQKLGCIACLVWQTGMQGTRAAAAQTTCGSCENPARKSDEQKHG